MSDEVNTKLKFVVLSIFLVTLGGVLLWIGFRQTQPNLSLSQVPIPTSPVITISPFPLKLETQNEEFKVSRVIDGDTIEISTGEKIRYIGIDTPETVDPRRSVGCFGKEASDENKKLVEGKNVVLAKDVSETDKYNRLLRYVYVKRDNGNLIFINDYLVRQGFAKASTYPPDVKFATQFVEAEREARENQRGLWGKCTM